MFKGGKLKFKGDGGKNKQLYAGVSKASGAVKVQKTPLQESTQLQALRAELGNVPEDGWMRAVEADDLRGPIFFAVPDEHFMMLAVDEDSSSVSADATGSAGPPQEPLGVANVFVGQTLIPAVFSFKSAYGRYLSADHMGQVAAGKEAVGPGEEWTLVAKADGWALQNGHNRFLSVDRKTGRGKGCRVRCDSETVGFAETFLVFCQASRKRERLLKAIEAESSSISQLASSSRLDLSELEAEEARKHHSFGWGRQRRPDTATSSQSPSRRADLQQAAEEGNLREALLERRIKSKHDPFC